MSGEKSKRVVGYIPARIGSTRVKAKNLRLLNGRPLLSYVMEAAKQTSRVDRFFVNTESDVIATLADRSGVSVYRRPDSLASDRTMTDEIVADFVSNNPCDAVVVVNPTAPFLRAETIDNAVNSFLKSECDALFSVSSLKKHALFQGEPLNFRRSQLSPRTQDLVPVQYINFLICIFSTSYLVEQYKKEGHFLYSGRCMYFPIDDEESFDIDYEYEFWLAESLMQQRSSVATPAKYFSEENE